MSSHHIVRENQEPALLVLDFRALDSENLGQLLEWSPTIITNEQNYDHFVINDIKVDILFGEDSFSIDQEETKVLPISDNFLEDALAYLIGNNYKAVNILATNLVNDLAKYADRINIVVFAEDKRFVAVKNHFEKWKPCGENIYIHDSFLKSFSGVEFVKNGMFQVKQDGFINLEFNTDAYIFLGEDL